MTLTAVSHPVLYSNSKLRLIELSHYHDSLPILTGHESVNCYQEVIIEKSEFCTSLNWIPLCFLILIHKI